MGGGGGGNPKPGGGAPAPPKGRGIVTILQEEGIATLYRGAGWTAARNAPAGVGWGAGAFLGSCQAWSVVVVNCDV